MKNYRQEPTDALNLSRNNCRLGKEKRLLIKHEPDKTIALYCRLSNADKTNNDYSISIQNQMDILNSYSKEHGFSNTQFYIDDGISGAYSDRPGYMDMINDIESGKVNTVIVKDHSRLGRDRLSIGYLLEILFLEKQVRYITADGKVDTGLYGVPDGLAFEDLCNEWYVKSTSEKVRRTKQKNSAEGKSLRSRAPYGYTKDPNDKFHLIPNPETMNNIVLIFEMFANGTSLMDISKELRHRKVLSPSAYDFQTLGSYGTAESKEDPYYWDIGTLTYMLDNEVYIGTTVNGLRYKPSYKSRKIIKMPKESHKRFENTHTAIISKELWDTVRQRRETKQRHSMTGEKDIFSGKLFCKDCGSVLHTNKNCYMCGRYKKYQYRDGNGCTPHNISKSVVREIVLSAIKAVTEQVKEHKKDFIQAATQNSDKEISKEKVRIERVLSKARNEVEELDRYLMNLYKDKVDGEITAEQFSVLADGYTRSKEEQLNRIAEANKKLQELNSKTIDVERFIAVTNKYTDISELNQEIVNAFIERIVIHERSEPHKRKGYTQKVDIYFNFIGKLGGS